MASWSSVNAHLGPRQAAPLAASRCGGACRGLKGCGFGRVSHRRNSSRGAFTTLAVYSLDSSSTGSFSSAEDAPLIAQSASQQLSQQVQPEEEPPRFLGWLSNRAQEDEVVNAATNVGVLAFAGAALVAHIASSESGSAWELYQQAVAANPVATKAFISGVVYSLGDIMAQSYEGRSVAEWDRARVVRSGLCGFLAHGPLSHYYYLALDGAFAHLQVPSSEWVTPLLKMGVDQTVWSLFWNSTYYVLLGALKLESPRTIVQTVRNTWWDLLKAGWRLWPFVHIVTYGLLPVQHRLLFVDAVELVWVTILSVYGQQQRRALAATDGGPGPVACALPGGDGEGGDPAEEILRGMQVEREIAFEDAHGHHVAVDAAEVYAHPATMPLMLTEEHPQRQS